MENKPTAPWLIALVTSLALIVFSLVIYFTDQLANKYITVYAFNGLIMAVIIWACIQYAKQMNGDVTFGNIFGFGFKIAAGIAAIMCVFTVISVKFIYPEIIEKTIDISRAEMEKKPEISTEQIDMFVNMMRKSFLLFAVIGYLFNTAFWGAIASLIGAAFARKNPSTPFENAG